MNIVHRVLAAREGSHVKRCHVFQHHGEYTVGKHSFDAAMLLLILHPSPSMTLLKAVLMHDLGERWVGDLPRTAKEHAPEMAKLHEELEKRLLKIYDFHIELDQFDQKWLKAIDLLEIYLWSFEQKMLGNKNAQDFIRRVEKCFEEDCEIPSEVLEFLHQYRHYLSTHVTLRLEDLK